MTDHPADPPSPLTAEAEKQVRAMAADTYDLTGLSDPMYATTALLLGALRKTLATLDAARASDAGLRAALVLLRRSVEGRCGNPLCPSAHVNWGEDCIEFALSHVESAALASSPAPAGLDDAGVDVEAIADALIASVKWRLDEGDSPHIKGSHSRHAIVEELRAALASSPAPAGRPEQAVSGLGDARPIALSSPAPAGLDERKALFEAGRATGTVEGWADYTHDDEYDALARQLHESIAEGQSVAETAKALRILAPAPAGLDDIDARRFTRWFLMQERGKQADWMRAVAPSLSDLTGWEPGSATRPAEDDHGWEAYKDAFPAGKNIVESPRPAEDAGERP